MGTSSSEIGEVIKRRLENFEAELVSADVGRVVTVGDGIAEIYGLQGAMAGELLEFPGDTFGMALNLEEDAVRAVIMGTYGHIQEGAEVRTTGRIVEVPVGPELIGRVVSPLGEPLDGKGPINAKKTSPVEKVAPGVITRQPVDTPVQTGIKSIDAMIPVGRGQRELIIGDRQTGKTAILLDTIINQKGKDLVCVYCAIGQNASSIARTRAILEEYGAMDYTIIVAATASEPAPLVYLAPYAACAIGEYFMEEGKDALCCYDDLTKHAWAYREMSLNLRRPPGREAYPGDVFYLHSRLLERAARMNKANGGGSLTALPVIETQAGDVSAYIPTNVISITDGQIFLETDLFNAGSRPAISVGISVSRVGSAAQTRPMSKVAGRMKLELAQARELAAFAQFASDLDPGTRQQLERGQRLTELLKQDQYEPVPLAIQVGSIYAGTRGHLDKVELNRIKEWQEGFARFLKAEHADYIDLIEKEGRWDDETDSRTEDIVSQFNRQFGTTGYETHESKGGSPGKPGSGSQDGATDAGTQPDQPKQPDQPNVEEPGGAQADAGPPAAPEPEPAAPTEEPNDDSGKLSEPSPPKRAPRARNQKQG